MNKQGPRHRARGALKGQKLRIKWWNYWLSRSFWSKRYTWQCKTWNCIFNGCCGLKAYLCKPSSVQSFSGHVASQPFFFLSFSLLSQHVATTKRAGAWTMSQKKKVPSWRQIQSRSFWKAFFFFNLSNNVKLKPCHNSCWPMFGINQWTN